jgi:eukaryotic-like serine/threonine-protein kinase
VNPSGTQVYNSLALSPDGKKAAVEIGNPKSVIWIYDVEHNTRTRFTFGSGTAQSAQWSHDGKQIAFMTSGETEAAKLHFAVKSSDGSGEAVKLLDSDYSPGEIQQAVWDWSPDGRYLLYASGHYGKGNGIDIWALPLFGDHKPFPYITGPGDQEFARFSPDGRWVVYVSSETGLFEIYVAPFPWTGAKWQISNGGGTFPFWRQDGKEILYQAMGSPFHWAAQVDGHGSSFSVGQVLTLFESDTLSPNTSAAQYAITGDAQRFLEITTGEAGKLPLTVIQNWTAQLQGK